MGESISHFGRRWCLAERRIIISTMWELVKPIAGTKGRKKWLFWGRILRLEYELSVCGYDERPAEEYQECLLNLGSFASPKLRLLNLNNECYTTVSIEFIEACLNEIIPFIESTIIYNRRLFELRKLLEFKQLSSLPIFSSS